jgi:inorganic pyrophosphatase
MAPSRSRAAGALAAVVRRIPPREAGTRRVHVIIDTPAGSRNKYKLDSVHGLLRLSRILPEGAVFPYDFGSSPGTCAEDGDALDVLVLYSPPTFPGCLVTVRLIGMLRVEQREGGGLVRNDRLLGVPETSVNPAPLRELRAVPKEHLRAIEHFFTSYNAFQGRQFRIIGRDGARRAEQALQRAIRTYQRRSTP